MDVYAADTSEPILRIEDVVDMDQNGAVRYEAESWGSVNDDSTIAPWIDVPPTPPPKSPVHGKPSSSSRSLGFATKSSFASFVSLGQGSATNLLRGTTTRAPTSSDTQHAGGSSSLHVPDYKRRSTEDAILGGDSASARGGVAHSSSSTYSGELKKPKSLFSKLRSRASKTHLRAESDETEQIPQLHPSLQPPVPPLPKERSANGHHHHHHHAHQPHAPPTISLPPPGKKDKREKGKKKSGASAAQQAGLNKTPPLDPAIAHFATELALNPKKGIVGLDESVMAGIVDTKAASKAAAAAAGGNIMNGYHHHPSSHSPLSSSGIDSAQTFESPASSDAHGMHGFINPWQLPSATTSAVDKRKGVMVPPTAGAGAGVGSNGTVDPRKVSPKSVHPPTFPNTSSSGLALSIPGSVSLGGYPSGSPVVGPGAGAGTEKWVPPESWEIVNPGDAYDALGTGEASETQESSSEEGEAGGRGEEGSDDGLGMGMGMGMVARAGTSLGGSLKARDERGASRRRKDTASASFSSAVSAFSSSTTTTAATSAPTVGLAGRKGSSGPLVRFPYVHARPQSKFQFRIYRQTGEYHVVSLPVATTVQELSDKIVSKLSKEDQHIQHNLYLKEQGRERMLAAHECPAAIVKLRQEQAGYDYEDGQYLFSNEPLNMLLKFVYKSQVLAGEEQIQFDNYDFVDLSGRGLRTIPVVLHQHADSIISLRLSRNPMIEIPLDFIQSCTILRELRLSNMAMKKVPSSLRHSTTLHKLDLSCNSIKDLEEAYLDHIHGLITLLVQNNRLEKLPWHFPRLKHLLTLNISNNKFRRFPPVLTAMESLRDLDISFNMITELPEDIGKITTLERFILVGNSVAKFPYEFASLVNLRVLDCRRNRISDLAVVCMLPQLNNLSADHNAVHALDLSLGPHLTTLDVSHNDITLLSMVPGPMGKPPYALTSLDLSYAKLSSLDDLALSQLSSLRTLRMDHNSIRSIPDSLGELRWLETLSCTDNKLDALPATIGNLQKLEILDAHNNSLTELPQSLWNCASLMKINVTSNFIGTWHDPPVVPPSDAPIVMEGGTSLATFVTDRKTSAASIASSRMLPSLVHSLERLYLGENCLTDNDLHPLMIFKELRVLNLSFNEIQDLPSNFFRNMTQLEEIYLSGNKLTSLPSEDLHKLTRLSTLFLNANKLHTLPRELSEVKALTILDVGSNSLRYNINNLDYDWNWNFNPALKYLNLSGNKKLRIKTDSRPAGGTTDRRSTQSSNQLLSMWSGFSNLSQIKVLGLMDVTISTTAKDATIDIPDEQLDRRIRTSLSTVCGMGYGIADSMGKNDHLTMLDLVYEFPGGRQGEAIFAMFGRTHPARHLKPGSTPNKLAKFVHDSFVNVFMTQLAAANEKLKNEGVPVHQRREGIPKALHWTFLKLNQDLFNAVNNTPRKNSHASTGTSAVYDSQYAKVGVSGIALYFADKTLFAANCGDALAVVSRQGVCVEISKKHDPYDRSETARIRAAEGFISPPGLVNDEVEVSRSFGYFNFFPTLNAKPDIFMYELTDMDEFVIVANRGLWDYVPYQTAVDIARTVARTDRPDAMLAAQKLRDFAISYGADGSTMIMVIWVADLVEASSRSRKPTLDSIVDPQMYRSRKKDEVRDRVINRLMGEVPPPTGHVTLVFTDIRNSTHLWESNPGMPSAMRLHNHLVRRQLRFCGGYEVKTEGDAFMCSFPTTLAAVWFCLTVQLQLLHESWPLEILQCEDGKPINDDEGRLVARGLSVRMGIHSGTPLCETDVITHRMDYFGPMVNRSARINGCAKGGQIMVSNDIIREIKASIEMTEEPTEYSRQQSPAAIDAIRRLGVVIMQVGEVKLKGIELPEILSAIYPAGVEGRHELQEGPNPEREPEPFMPDTLEDQLAPLARALGSATLRVETIPTQRFFKPQTGRKDSIQSNNEAEEPSRIALFRADPALLLPTLNDYLSHEEFTQVLDSLVTRIENAVEAVAKQHNFGPPSTASKSRDALLRALADDGALDQDTMEYIASVLDRL